MTRKSKPIESYSKEVIFEYLDRYLPFWRQRIDFDLLDILESIAASNREDRQLAKIKQRITEIETKPANVKTSRQLRLLKNQEDDLWSRMLRRMKREEKKRNIRKKKRDAEDAQLTFNQTTVQIS